MWLGPGIMKTVAAPIYFGLYKVQKPQYQQIKRKANLEEVLLAGGTRVWLP